MRKLTLLDLGQRDYSEVWHIQEDLVKEVISGASQDTLILVEHTPVVTLGRQGSEEDVLVSFEDLSRRGIQFFKVDRGGRATFHGPGQLVAYPILSLLGQDRDIHNYLRNLEAVIIGLLAGLDLRGEGKEDQAGVWIDEQKVASIGVGVKKWVTYHGLALNVDIDLDYFSLIDPCGVGQAKITSLAKVLSSQVRMDKIKKSFVSSFSEVFKRMPIPESYSSFPSERCQEMASFR
ncbi:MAG: lipoyl(octanoyl) transferase LipB [Candidatus Aerophobetes bacterium]